MIVLYHETRELRETIERLLADVELESTASRVEFQALLGDASVGIVVLRQCSAADVQWLRSVFRSGLLEPSCVVITSLSLFRLQRLRKVESNRFHVVWAEEVSDRLVGVLTGVEPWHRDPLRLLGQRIVGESALHWSLVKAIEHICKLSDDPSPDPPANSVNALALHVRLPPDSLRRYWREEVPLKCGPKQLLSWAVLFWAVRQRPKAKWDVIAKQAGVGRRTLERYGKQLAGCTLAAAGRDPQSLKRRFRRWIAEVSEVDRRADAPPHADDPLIAGS